MQSMVEGARRRDGDAAMSAVVDFPVKPEAQPYLNAFKGSVGEPDWLARLRHQALSRFSETGFPGRKSENWRYLDLQPLADEPLLPAPPGHFSSVPAELTPPVAQLRLVMVDGRYVPGLSQLDLPTGVWLGSMCEAIFVERHQLGELVRTRLTGAGTEHPLAALDAALFVDGFVLDIAPGIQLETPIEIVHLGSDARAASFHTRSVINLGEASSANILEVYAGKGRYWRNDVISVDLAAGAALNRAVLVEEAAEAIHLALTDARLAAGAQLHGFALLLGGRTVRHEANVAIIGEGAQCRLDGAYIVTGNDEANIVTAVDHAAPGGQTRELIKGVAAGRGHGAFQGKIIVREHAQKTDAHQLSRNLIIGERAVIDTKPELEIYADDVKCSHGASVGDLDEAALFYLRARGIPAEEARHMLVDAFLREAVETVEDFAIRTHLLRRLAARLAGLEGSS